MWLRGPDGLFLVCIVVEVLVELLVDVLVELLPHPLLLP